MRQRIVLEGWLEHRVDVRPGGKIVHWARLHGNGKLPVTARVKDIDYGEVHAKLAREPNDDRLRALLGESSFRERPVVIEELNWRTRGRWHRRHVNVGRGHHRLEAARRNRWRTIDIEVAVFWFWPPDGRPRDRAHLVTTLEDRRGR